MAKLHGKKASQERLERARDREEEASHRKPSQQLANLDKRLGSGVGATRERTRLRHLIGESLDFPLAKRQELIKNKAKKQKQEEAKAETEECQTNTTTDSKKSSQRPKQQSKTS